MRISDGVQTCALPISRIPAQRPVFLRDPRKVDEDGMQRRSQEALTAMRQILRATENYARRLSRLTGLTASQLLLLQVLDQHGETTAGQIAAHMGITQATTTSLLHKLEDRKSTRLNSSH